VFGLFRDKELERFAAELAGQLASRVPPATLDKRASDPQYEKTLTKAFHHVFLSAQNYCRDHKIGLLKRARLSKVFQDELKSLGYQGDVVREVTVRLAEQLTKI